MSKRLYDAMTSELECFLAGVKLELLSIEQGMKKDEDGNQEPFTRVEVEIPRGSGAFSRCRFSCKLPPVKLNISEEEIESGISIVLLGVKVTYVSAQKEIYTKADSIQVV